MRYWYENKGLLKIEKDGYAEFENKKFPDTNIKYDYDKEKRMVVFVEFSYRVSKDALIDMITKDKKLRLPEEQKKEACRKIENYGEPPKRHFKFLMRYEHTFPGRDSRGLLGGDIRAYVMTKLNKSNPHLVKDHSTGNVYVCQVREASSEKVNSTMLMKHILRFCDRYQLWEITGIDTEHYY